MSHAAVLCRLGRTHEGVALLDRVANAAVHHKPWWAVRAEALSALDAPDA